MKRFLVIRFSSIGDIVLTSPVVRCLKQQFEGAEIHYITKSKYAPLLKANPYIDKLHLMEDQLNGMITKLQQEQFDYVIDLHQNIRSYRIKRGLRAKSFSFKKLNVQKWLLVNWKIDHLPNLHIVDRYMRTVSGLGIKYDGKGLDCFIPDDEGYSLDKLPVDFHDGYIAFVIGGTYATKRLPPARVIDICSKVQFPVILLGGKKEKAEAANIVSESNGKILNLVGHTTLSESATLVKNARLVISNDTGLMHMAAAFNKKILSFWGNTIPGFGMDPYFAHPASLAMQVDGLKCRPCSKLGYEKCPKKHFRCMNDQDLAGAVLWITNNF